MTTTGQQLTAPEPGWQRINNTDAKILYSDSSFGVASDGGDYSGNDTRSKSTTASIEFSFVGSKLRLIEVLNYDWSTNVTITIDGISYNVSMYRPSPQYQTIYFEKLDLEYKTHKVKITSSVAAFWGIDCIDIDDTGYLISRLGNQVPTPEPGWIRFDDTALGLTYSGTWSRRSDGSTYATYNSTWIESYAVNSSATFTMVSSRLRVMTYGNIDTSGFEIKIDGISYGNFKSSYGITRCLLSGEINGLTFDKHYVEIILKDKSLFTSSSTTRIILDAIDIDDLGWIETAGAVLNTPETGWNRYDDSDTKIVYTNMKSINTGDSTNYLNGNVHVLDDNTKAGSIRIKTTGTKIRLICPLAVNRNVDVRVYIDGVYVGSFSAPSKVLNGKSVYYESPNIPHPNKKFITFEFVYSGPECNAMFDCLDTNGYIAANQSVEDYTCENSSNIYTFNTPAMSQIQVNYPGVYAIECWGANGAGNENRNAGSSGGRGGYTYGEVYLSQDDILYIYPGGAGAYSGTFTGGGFNGGGNGCYGGGGGGGASDVRLNINDLAHRIIVAGGGGGSDDYLNGAGYRGSDNDGSGGDGGGLSAQGAWIDGMYYATYGATQTSGYALGQGGSATAYTDTGGAGGGYWGGKVSNHYNGGAGGGSSYYGNMMNAYTISGVNWGNGLVKLTLLEEDNYNNLQHFAIFSEDKYYIPTARYFDSTTMNFIPMSLVQLYNPNLNPATLVTNILDIFKSFTINGKSIYPLDYIKSSYNVKIVKIMCHNISLPSVINNKNRKEITFHTDFNNLFKATLIRLKDVVNIKFDEMRNYLTSTPIDAIRFGIRSNSVLYGKNFEVISEDDLQIKGFDYSDLSSIEIPFDNIRMYVKFTRNCGSTEEFKFFKITKKKNNLKRLLTDEDYIVLIKEVENKNNIYIKILSDTITNITVNKLAHDETEYRVKNTLDTF